MHTDIDTARPWLPQRIRVQVFLPQRIRVRVRTRPLAKPLHVSFPKYQIPTEGKKVFTEQNGFWPMLQGDFSQLMDKKKAYLDEK